MHGGNDDEGYGSQQKKNNNAPKEKQTLTPLTVKMFNDSSINQSDLLEYESIPLHEVTIIE